MRLLIDTSFLYATMDRSDRHHKKVLETLKHLRNETLVLPVPTLVELGILMNDRLGQRNTAQCIAMIKEGPIRLEPLIRADLTRVGELLLQYQDARLDFVDAAITSIAERLDIRRILTVDQRDFRLIRPRHCAYFEILP